MSTPNACIFGTIRSRGEAESGLSLYIKRAVTEFSGGARMKKIITLLFAELEVHIRNLERLLRATITAAR